MHGPLETARHVQAAFGIERQGRRVRQVGHEGLARSVGAHDEDGDRPLLPARPAERDVEIAVRVECGTVDLVEPGRQGGADVDERGFTRCVLDPYRGMPAVESGRNNGAQFGRRGAREPRRHVRR